jgi:hypothetical protein
VIFGLTGKTREIGVALERIDGLPNSHALQRVANAFLPAQGLARQLTPNFEEMS